MGTINSKIGEKMKLNDEVIAHIAKLLQIAILTGTDLTDNMRLIRLQDDNGELFLDEEYSIKSDENIKKMLNDIPALKE